MMQIQNKQINRINKQISVNIDHNIFQIKLNMKLVKIFNKFNKFMNNKCNLSSKVYKLSLKLFIQNNNLFNLDISLIIL